MRSLQILVLLAFCFRPQGVHGEEKEIKERFEKTSSLGCYKESLENPQFTVSAGDYSPDSLTSVDCMVACYNDHFVYAAVENGRLCLCAMDIQGLDSSDDEGPCNDGEELFAWVYKVDNNNNRGNSSATNNNDNDIDFQIILGTEPFTNKEPTSFEVKLDSKGSSVSLWTIDFGDGSPIVERSDIPDQVNHHYVIPGSYIILVTAFDENQEVLAQSHVTVEESAEEGDVDIQCPDKALPHQQIVCNITVSGGTSMELTIKMKQEDSTVIQLPDIPLLGFGTPPPQESVSETSDTSSKYIVLQESLIDRRSQLIGIEVYANKQGDIQILALKPKCEENDDGYCSALEVCPQTCTHQCLAKTTFESAMRRCWSEEVDCSSESFPKNGFEERNKTSVTIEKEGYNVIWLKDKEFVFEEGDVIAFFQSDTIIGNRNSKDEKGDWIGENLESMDDRQLLHFLRVLVRNPMTLQHSYTYEEAGDYEAEFSVSAVSSPQPMVKEETFSVQIPLEGLQLTVEPQNPKPGEEVEFQVTFTNGSDATIHWIYENGSIEESSHKGVYPNSKPPPKKITYNRGKHTIQVNASNAWGSTEPAEITIICDWPINENDWEFSVSDKVKKTPPGLINAKLTYTGDPENFPSDATVELTWKENQMDSYILKTEDKDTPVEFSYSYTKEGNYILHLEIKNEASNITKTQEVEILQAIRIFAKPYYSDDKKHREGFGSEKNIFPPNSDIVLDLQQSEGTIDGFRVKFSGSSEEKSYPKGDSITFPAGQDLKTIDITITGYNKMEEQSDPFTISIIISDLMMGLEILDVDCNDANTTKFFEITVASASEDSCFVINYGDKERLEFYGNKDVCDKISLKSKSKYVREFESPLNISHIYKDRGNYTLLVDVYQDNKNSMSSSLDFVVTQCPPYDEPFVIIKTMYSEGIASSTELMRSKRAKIETKALVNYTEPFNFSISWRVTEVDPLSGKELIQGSNLINNSIWTSWNKSILFIDERFLEYGSYKAVVYYSFNLSNTIPEFPYFRSNSTFFKIIQSPLIPAMKEDGITEFIIGNVQEFLLEPQQFSIDPDYPDEKNFTFKWFCHQLGETLPEDSETIQEFPTEKPSGNNGGCFGQGPGRFNYSEGRLLMPAELLTTGNTYVFTTHISKDTRSGTAAIKIQVVEGQPPRLALWCQRQKDACFVTEKGVLINGAHRLMVYSSCEAYCDPPIDRWDWSLHEADENSAPIPDSSQYLIGQDDNIMVIQDDFFKTGIKVFKLRTTGTAADGEIGFTGLELHINEPPEKGTCQINPKTGKALVEEFHVECSGWIDPEGMGIESYSIYLKKDGVEMLLLTSAYNIHEVILPYGKDMVLWAVIEDDFKASTLYTIDTISTQLPTQEEFDKFNSENVVLQLTASGEQSKMAQAYVAQMSVLEYYPLEGYVDNDNLTDAEKRDRLSIAKGEYINEFLSHMGDMNLNTLNDMNMMSSTLSNIIGNGDYLGRAGKAFTRELMNKMKDKVQSNTLKFAAPQQLQFLLTNIASTMAGMAQSISSTVIKQDIKPIDWKYADDIDYDTSIDNDPNFVVPSDPTQQKQRGITEDASYEARKQISDMLMMVNDLTTICLRNMAKGEDPIVIDAPNDVQMTFNRVPHSVLGKEEAYGGGGGVKFPDYCQLVNDEGCMDNVSMAYAAITWPTVMHNFGENLDRLNPHTKIVQVTLFDGELSETKEIKVTNASEPIIITIPRTASTNHSKEPELLRPKLKYVESIGEYIESMKYHRINVADHDCTLSIKLTPELETGNYIIYLRYQKKPLLNNYDYSQHLQTKDLIDGSYEIILESETLDNRTGYFYLGVAELNSTSYNDEVNITDSMVNHEFQVGYQLSFFTSACLFYDEDYKKWWSRGCKVAKVTDLETVCHCTHLTSFGSNLFIAPNAIDFNYVFANASFADNLTIYVTIIVTLTFFILFLIWARYKDRKDVEKLGALPLPDNNSADKYLYEIIVFTGSAIGATTDSKIQFILSGDKEETDIRTFGKPPRKVFRRDGADIFVMATSRTLGQLQFLRIWHDNSGKNEYASWFLNYIIFRDVQTGEKFEFICNQWLAVDKEDGQIDRLLPVAGKDDLTEFDHLFKTTSRKKLTDGHLWFSVFLRPPRSRFTRCQRVGACIALLYLSMLVNAMWYERTKDQPSAGGLGIGPFTLSPEQMGVGFFSSLIVFPPSFLIVFLFRKSRPRKLRPSRVNEALKKQRPLSAESQQSENKNEPNKKIPPPIFKRKKRFTLPWIFTYIGWLLVIACILVSVFFLWAYGIQFGNEKTKKWLASLLISFFSSILITQPIKVFFVAMFMSAICKKVETDEDDADEDEEEPQLQADEEWMYTTGDPTKPRKIGYKTEDSERLERIRQSRLKEKGMKTILKEIFSYLMFLYVMSVVTYGIFDPNAFLLQDNLRRTFVHNHLGLTTWTTIHDTDDFYLYLQDFIGLVRAQRRYDGKPAFGLKGFLNDGVNRIMGNSVVRQIRMKPGTCIVPRKMKNYVRNCTGEYPMILNEDSESYGPGWTKTNVTDFPEGQQFRYRSAKEIKGVPFQGNFDTYSGGGYVWELTENQKTIIDKIKMLRENRWIDQYTRAIMIEFSVYNAQVNLFGVAILYAEFVPGGGIISDYCTDAVRLLPHSDNFAIFIVLCEILTILFIIYFTIRELKLVCKGFKEYFKTYWSYAEWAVILLSYISIAVYIIRQIETTRILEEFKKTKGNVYINIAIPYLCSTVFNYSVSFVVFISIIKIIRLLRFNKRFGILSSTLRQCADDLMSFGVAFGVVIFTAMQVFNMFFATYSHDFCTMMTTFQSLFSVMLNRFEFDDFTEAHAIWGPVIFFLFAFFVNIVLINIFLTVIIRSFETVKHDLSKQRNEYEILDFIFGRLRGMVGRPPKPDDGDTDCPVTSMAPEDNNPTNEFPEKVDQLIRYINSTYLDGKLDLNKDFMRGYGRRRTPNFIPYGKDYLKNQPTVYSSN